MRIVHVTLRFDAPGGVEANVHEVTRRLLVAGEDVRVFASDLYDEGRWERRINYRPTVDGVPVRRFPVFKRLVPGLTMPLMTGLIDALRTEPVDLIHAHSHRYGHVLEAALVARRRRIPFVVSTHYHPADRGEPPLKRGMLRVQDIGFGMTAYRAADALVVETHQEAARIAEFAPATKVRVIPPGVDLEEWGRPETANPPSGLPDRYLLWAGRIAPNKGLSGLVRSLAMIPKGERIPLVILGRDWGERPALETLAASLGVTDDLVWLGHLDDPAQFRTTFRRAALFVLPSEWEAFGLVLLQAMAAGVPILATAVGGVPEVLDQGHAGRLVPYGDPPALAAGIRELLGDPRAAKALAEGGRARVKEFTWARAAERHLSLYRELTQRGSAS